MARPANQWTKRAAVLVPALLCPLLLVLSGPGEGTAPTSIAVPGPVRTVLEKSCMNCHSGSWSIPFAARFWPASAYFMHTIQSARARVDFSEWHALSGEKAAVRKRKIARALRNGYMPPIEYTWFHPSAKLTEAERAVLLEWSRQ